MNSDPNPRKTQVRTLFNAVAPDYDAGPGCFAYFGRRLARVSNIGPGHRVLDVAIGRGAVLFPAAEQAGPTGDVIGVDLADAMASATNAEAAQRGLKARVKVMDAEQLDFPDATFDRIVCGFGIMFFPDQERALGEFRRVLKPGGQVGLSTWRISQTSELDAAMAQVGIEAQRAPGWITEPEDLAALLERAGFTNIRVDMDSQSFRYADADEIWRQARGTGMRRTVDALDEPQTAKVRAALAERMRAQQRQDGFHILSTALLAVATR